MASSITFTTVTDLDGFLAFPGFALALSALLQTRAGPGGRFNRTDVRFTALSGI